MLGFENTYTIEKQIRDVPRQTVRQEVRVIDGSLFITHWHINREYWSYDQLTENLINAYDFSIPKRELLGEIWENLKDIISSINEMNHTDGISELYTGNLIIKRKKMR